MLRGSDQLTERARRLLDAISEGVCEVDQAGCFAYVNPRAAHLLGHLPETLIGKSVHEAIHPPLNDDSTPFVAACALCEALQSHEPREGRTYFRHASGYGIPVLYSIVPIHSRSAKYSGAVMAFFDDSERLRAEQEIARLNADNAEAERRRNAFIAVLSHELRNPLAPIRSALQLMRKVETNDRTLSELRDMMERQLGQLVHLINDLMDIARLTSDKIALKRDRVSLQKILSSAIEASAALMSASHNPLTADMPQQPLFLDADATRLTQVFTNLLNNASQYSAAGSPILVSVSTNVLPPIVM